jgi:cytochrome c55X
MTLFNWFDLNVKCSLKRAIVLFYLSIASISSALFAAPAEELSQDRKSELSHIVKQDCGSCHGMTLKGGLGSPILPADLNGKSIDFLTLTILEGRPNTAMPPWKAIVSKNEARWIAKQLKKGTFK